MSPVTLSVLMMSTTSVCSIDIRPQLLFYKQSKKEAPPGDTFFLGFLDFLNS
jgi:hypothetical protein